MMICNRCLKKDVCSLKEQTEPKEQELKASNPHIEIDCKHRVKGEPNVMRDMALRMSESSRGRE